MWAWTTSSRDNWERLVAAVIKRDQIWQLCHQDSITTVDSDFSERNLSLRSVSSSPSPQLPVTRDSAVDVKKNGSGTITRKLFSALLRRKKSKSWVGIPDDHFGLEIFSLRELLVGTDHFNERNIIGWGGYDKVYRGRFPDGSLVAVKRLNPGARVMIAEELEISSMVAHRNVVGLIGFCIAGKERLLVYPFMANRSVGQCLRERSESQPPLEWAMRPHIALGVARGLAHLHHGCIRGIIHLDVKATNILLGEHFEAFVSDFTFAKFVDSCNDDDGIAGTLGHIAPEYLITGQHISKLMRLAYGKREIILDWVKKFFEESEFEAFVDGDLRGNFIEEDVRKLLQIALICIHHDPNDRPTMSEVVMMLEDGDGLTEAWEKFLQNPSKILSFSRADWIISDEEGISEDELFLPR